MPVSSMMSLMQYGLFTMIPLNASQFGLSSLKRQKSRKIKLEQIQ